MSVTKILWLTRHKIQYAQRKELKKRFGKVKIINPNPNERINDVDRIEEIINKYKINEIVTVPYYLINELTNRGYKPLKAIMEKINYKGGFHEFRHKFFRRFNNLEINKNKLLDEIDKKCS